MGIGLHAGPAIVGEMGYGRAISLTAIGDTVNVASRLEALTKELGGQLVVSAHWPSAPGRPRRFARPRSRSAAGGARSASAGRERAQPAAPAPPPQVVTWPGWTAILRRGRRALGAAP